MNLCWRPLILCLMCMTVVSCSSSSTLAPVTDVTAYEAVIQSGAQRPYHPYSVKPASTVIHHEAPHANVPVTQWMWPAQGAVLSSFSSNNKGIDIRGTIGEPVYASAPGRVVYAGGGLRGYGMLIIIKHNSQYLSAYAYNRHIYVKEGGWVKRGQKIAEMGYSASDKPVLHFEIRRDGIPVNPLNLLS